MFLGEPLGFFISICFHFFSLLFRLVSISSCHHFFRCFHFWLHLFTSLFLYCCCCYRECYGFERALFTFRRFLPYTLFQNLEKSDLFLSRHLWGWQFSYGGCRASHWGLKNRPCSSICLNLTVFGKRYYLVCCIYVLGTATSYYINCLFLVLNSLY